MAVHGWSLAPPRQAAATSTSNAILYDAKVGLDYKSAIHSQGDFMLISIVEQIINTGYTSPTIHSRLYRDS